MSHSHQGYRRGASEDGRSGFGLLHSGGWKSFESEDGYPRAGPSKFSKHGGRGHSQELQLHSTDFQLSNVFSQLLQNALIIVFGLNIVWYMIHLWFISYIIYLWEKVATSSVLAPSCEHPLARDIMGVADKSSALDSGGLHEGEPCTSMPQTLVTDRGRPWSHLAGTAHGKHLMDRWNEFIQVNGSKLSNSVFAYRCIHTDKPMDDRILKK